MQTDLSEFAAGLAELDLIEIDLAVALIWFFDYTGEAQESTASDLAKLLHKCSLTGVVNAGRLRTNLSAHPDTVQGTLPGRFKIKLARKAVLTEKYARLLKRARPKVDDHVLDTADFEGTRPYVENLVWQINGTYQLAFYDGCIVLCRRLIETLLIEAFVQNGKEDAILDDKRRYVQLGELISIAQSGHHIKLAHKSPKDLEEIKSAGDAGAHSRVYITKKQDIDGLQLRFRRVVAELMTVAKLAPKKAA